MNVWSPIVSLCLFAFLGLTPVAAQSLRETPSAERGREAARGRPSLKSPLSSLAAYQDVWKRWGLQEKPENFNEAVRERYGLHAAPYENDGLPMGLHANPWLLGKGIANDCLLCHAGRVAGQTIIGLGNASF